MSIDKYKEGCYSGTVKREHNAAGQKILVFQQNGSGESKTKGILRYGRGLFTIEVVSIDEKLPVLLDDTEGYLPRDIHADLVLDFLKHPDLSYDLAVACRNRKIPIVSSGKKLRVRWVWTPPT
jgi:hypothetical protein